jgi:hypothetical protein
MQWSVVTWRGASLIRSLPYTLACTAKSASGTAGGFIGRQPVTLRRNRLRGLPFCTEYSEIDHYNWYSHHKTSTAG